MITLGVPDVFTIRGIYEANEFNADNYTYCSRYTTRYSMTWFHSSHARGDKITAPSGAVGKIIQVTGTSVYFYYVTKDINFVVGEVVTNATSTATDSSESEAISAITVDSKDITNSFMLDDGQRDGYYGLAAIKRKAGAPTPSNKLLVIFDYFTAGSTPAGSVMFGI
jgi:hypothetical protein